MLLPGPCATCGHCWLPVLSQSKPLTPPHPQESPSGLLQPVALGPGEVCSLPRASVAGQLHVIVLPTRAADPGQLAGHICTVHKTALWRAKDRPHPAFLCSGLSPLARGPPTLGQEELPSHPCPFPSDVQGEKERRVKSSLVEEESL